ncbi:hypothetical protein DFJ73DRAFT_866518 [Zopfochytrium polystomum]|nr:hypothetical protein DFJ73DRAFT_866518 [Zopfochytrium polystomum]
MRGDSSPSFSPKQSLFSSSLFIIFFPFCFLPSHPLFCGVVVFESTPPSPSLVKRLVCALLVLQKVCSFYPFASAF